MHFPWHKQRRASNSQVLVLDGLQLYYLYKIPWCSSSCIWGKLIAHCNSSILRTDVQQMDVWWIYICSCELLWRDLRLKLQEDICQHVCKLQLAGSMSIGLLVPRQGSIAWRAKKELLPDWWTWSSAGDCKHIPQSLRSNGGFYTLGNAIHCFQLYLFAEKRWILAARLWSTEFWFRKRRICQKSLDACRVCTCPSCLKKYSVLHLPSSKTSGTSHQLK